MKKDSTGQKSWAISLISNATHDFNRGSKMPQNKTSDKSVYFIYHNALENYTSFMIT
ncbi:MAG: hypothetical protein PF570_01580 [Candidatus Cloacimonetes bacterium]|nr:hypothetical protein [Candidatus Cloacimonadota bacterium]